MDTIKLKPSNNLQFALDISILREDDSFIAYSPALDLSTVGATFEEAQKRFTEAVELFFEEITKNGTLGDVLSELGWQKEGNQLLPPIVVNNHIEKFTIPNYNHQ